MLYIEQMTYIHFISIVQDAKYGPSMLAADICTCTAAVGSSIGTAVVGVSVLCGVFLYVLVAYVLCYISRRSKESSYKPSSLADPVTVYDEVGTNKKMKGDAMEMNANTAYRSHVS